jgi:hypothetical protein
MLNLPGEGWIRKSVLFPVLTRGNKVILATAAHAVNEIAGHYTLVLCDSEGNEVPLKSSREAPVKTMILPPEYATDLAFMEVEMERMPSLVKFSTDPILNDTTLFHARNVIGRKEFEGKVCIKTEQKSNLLPEQYACVGNKYFERSEIAAQTVQRIPCPLRALAMQSWPGVSGSPLWNQSGRTVGMVCGGNVELTEEEQKYFLVFLPAATIRENLARYFK